jgi:hypothetical protein
VIQATVSTYLKRHEVVETELTREVEEEPEDEPTPSAGGTDGLLSRFSARLRRDEG